MAVLEYSSPPPKPAHGARLLQLDILRGVAILLVLFRHPIVYHDSQIKNVGWWKPLSFILMRFGWTGVDLFFVLSGFLIGGLLFQEIRKTGALDVKRFLIRRGFKIWPPYFVLIGFAFLWLIFAWHRSVHSALSAIAPNLLHLQNYLGTPRGPTWSLAVEEHFYLALPLFLLAVLYFARRPGRHLKSLRAIPVTAIAVIVSVTLFRTLYNWNKPFSFRDHVAYTHLRIDGLFFGVLLAYFHHFHADAMARVGRYRIALLIGGLALLSPMFFLDDSARFCWTIGFTMLYLGYGAILLALVYTTPGKGVVGSFLTLWPNRAIAWVGFFSYSIYLWQEDLSKTPIQYYLLHRLTWIPMPLYWPTLEALHLLFAIGAGALMAKLIEIPSIAMRDRLFPARTVKIDQHPVTEHDAEVQTASSTLAIPQKATA
ncbi:MAG TPA: acyltransferase [Tepidisphaeraceae bacterium]|nr:acyltransferase [Tepidisphaeraceae bacterium]